ncbi:hypothetical protein VTK26DRAFT_4835 [Humicola hyalothermophila]
MRFTSAALLALPLLSSSAAAAESPFEQYKAKFQNFLSSFGASSVPEKADSAEAAAAAASSAASAATGKAKKAVAAEPKQIETLRFDGWKETLYAPVQADASTPEEWLVLISGGNKTCYGHCARLEKAFNASALPFASLPDSQSDRLHLGYLNCDDHPVLCNAWSAGTGSLWHLELLPPPAPVVIHTRRFNLTTVTEQDLVDAFVKYKSGAEAEEAKKEQEQREKEKAEGGEGEGEKVKRRELRFVRFDNDGWLHPFDGKLARYGLNVPLGYAVWALNSIPSWAMMLAISFISRTMMNRRIDGMNRPANRAAGAAPRGAPPGDGRS